MGDEDGRRTPTEKMRALKSMLGDDESGTGGGSGSPAAHTSLRSLKGLLEVDAAPGPAASPSSSSSPAVASRGESGDRYGSGALSPALASPGLASPALGSARRGDDAAEAELRAAQRQAARLEREAQAAALREARKAEREELEAQRAAREEERAARRKAEIAARSAEEAAEKQRRAERRAEIEARRAAAETERLETEQRAQEAAERREQERQSRLAEMSVGDGSDEYEPPAAPTSWAAEPLSPQTAEMEAMEAQWERERRERRARMALMEDGEHIGAVDVLGQQPEPVAAGSTDAPEDDLQMVGLPAHRDDHHDDDVVALAMAAEQAEAELEAERQAHALEQERRQREEQFAQRAAEREAQLLQRQEEQVEREAELKRAAAVREEKRKADAELARAKREQANEEAAERAAARQAAAAQRQEEWATRMAEKEALRHAAAEQRESLTAARREQAETSPRSPISLAVGSPPATTLARDEPSEDTAQSGFSALEMLLAAQEAQTPQAGQQHRSDGHTSVQERQDAPATRGNLLGNAPSPTVAMFLSPTVSPAPQRESSSSSSRLTSDATPEDKSSHFAPHAYAAVSTDTGENLDSYLAAYEAQRQAKRAQWDEERQAAARQHEEEMAKAAEERAARRAAMEASRAAMMASIVGAEPDALVSPEPRRASTPPVPPGGGPLELKPPQQQPPPLPPRALQSPRLSQMSSAESHLRATPQMLLRSPTSPTPTPRAAADSPPPALTSSASYHEDQVDASPQPDMTAFSPIQSPAQVRRRWREPEPGLLPASAPEPEAEPELEQQPAPSATLMSLGMSLGSLRSTSITATSRLGGRDTESLGNARAAPQDNTLVDSVEPSVALQRRLGGAPTDADSDSGSTEAPPLRPPPARAPVKSLAAWRLSYGVSTAEDRFSTRASTSSTRSSYSGRILRESVNLATHDYRHSANDTSISIKPRSRLSTDPLASARSKSPARTSAMASPARRSASPIKYYLPSTTAQAPLLSATSTLDSILGRRTSTETARSRSPPARRATSPMGWLRTEKTATPDVEKPWAEGASAAPSLTELIARLKSGNSLQTSDGSRTVTSTASAIGSLSANRSNRLGNASAEIASHPQVSVSRPTTLDELLSTLGSTRSNGANTPRNAVKARRQAEWDSLSKSLGIAR